MEESIACICSAAQGDDNVDQDEINFGTSAGMKSMRVRKYPLPKTKAVLKYLEQEAKELARLIHRGLLRKGPIPASVFEQAAATTNADVAAAACTSAAVDAGGDDLEEMENAIRNNAAAARACRSRHHDHLDRPRAHPTRRETPA